MAHTSTRDVVNKMIMVRPVFGLSVRILLHIKLFLFGRMAASEGRKDQLAEDVLIDGSAVTRSPVSATLRLFVPSLMWSWLSC